MAPIYSKKNARAHERLRMITFRIRAYVWDANGKIFHAGFAFVSDFSENGIGLYLGKKLKLEEHVQIAFESENNPTIKATVVWCERYSLEQKFLGHAALSYRAGFHFLFASEMERQRYLSYLQEIKNKASDIKHSSVE